MFCLLGVDKDGCVSVVVQFLQVQKDCFDENYVHAKADLYKVSVPNSYTTVIYTDAYDPYTTAHVNGVYYYLSYYLCTTTYVYD